MRGMMGAPGTKRCFLSAFVGLAGLSMLVILLLATTPALSLSAASGQTVTARLVSQRVDIAPKCSDVAYHYVVSPATGGDCEPIEYSARYISTVWGVAKHLGHPDWMMRLCVLRPRGTLRFYDTLHPGHFNPRAIPKDYQIGGC
jgi:hypothetical protein